MISLDFVKSYLKIDSNEFDDFLLLSITVAINEAQKLTQLDLSTKIPENIQLGILFHVASLFEGNEESYIPSKSLNIYKTYKTIQI